DHTLIVSPTGLVTITGGKWTTWRKMAEDAVNKAVAVAALPEKKCITRQLPVHGYTTNPTGKEHLSVYGADAAAIEQLMQEPGMHKQLHPQYPYTVAEVAWAARHEMAQTVEDVLARRVRLLFTDARAAIQAAPLVARILAEELAKDDAWQQQQVEQFRQLAGHYVLG
ncbi:MAG: FAD-dependent oxidoreductase, partial [Dinghuibacter sp.]|nr:FAD-dependent oxidoreductase [Dinghuibacter sp.]